MTPKEKAEELHKKFHKTCNITIAGTSLLFEQIAKQCALIAVEEILGTFFLPIQDGVKNYWNEVKTEIEKL